MASGYNKPHFALNLKLKEHRHRLDKPGNVRILVKDGVTLPAPEVITNPAEVSVANRLRQEAPRSEWMIWPALEAMGFQHSVPMFGYYLDFYHPEIKLCVEIDGPVHMNRRPKDRRRDRSLRNAGIETRRFWAKTVYEEPDRVIQHIRNAVELRSPVREEKRHE